MTSGTHHGPPKSFPRFSKTNKIYDSHKNRPSSCINHSKRVRSLSTIVDVFHEKFRLTYYTKQNGVKPSLSITESVFIALCNLVDLINDIFIPVFATVPEWNHRYAKRRKSQKPVVVYDDQTQSGFIRVFVIRNLANRKVLPKKRLPWWEARTLTYFMKRLFH